MAQQHPQSPIRNLSTICGYPYLLVHREKNRDDIEVLPDRLSPDTLEAVARQRTIASESPATLVLGPAEAVRLDRDSPEPRRVAPPPPAEFLTVRIDGAVPTVTDGVLYRLRHLYAWHSYHRGFEPLVAPPSTAGGSRIVGDRRLLTLLQPDEVTRFLRVAHGVASRNRLLELPEQGDEFLSRLSWYRDLATAWRGGFIRKAWRAWLVDVATEADLFPADAARAVARVHGQEASRPGADADSFGQAFARELPDLFGRIDKRALESATREAFIGFRVA